MDCERLSRRIRPCSSTLESKDCGSALCHRISVAAQYGIRQNASNLWNRSRNVLSRQFGTLLERRNQEDCDPTQRKSRATRKSTGPPETRKPSSGSRGTYRAHETQGTWEKQDENRLGGFNLRIPIRAFLQFRPSHARSEPTASDGKKITRRINKERARPQGTPLLNTPRSFGPEGTQDKFCRVKRDRI